MKTRVPYPVRVATRALALLLLLGVPVRAVAQEPSPGAAPPVTAVKDLPLTAAQRGTYVGNYSVDLPQGGRTVLRVFEEDGVLKARPDNETGSHRLLYQGENAFVPEGVPDFVFSFVVENGRATMFTVRREDGVMIGVRVR